jgi:hypothetical protein
LSCWAAIDEVIFLLRGVLGVVRKSGRESSNFVFYCIFMIQFFKVFWGGTWGAPYSPSPVCIYVGSSKFKNLCLRLLGPEAKQFLTTTWPDLNCLPDSHSRKPPSEFRQYSTLHAMHKLVKILIMNTILSGNIH